MADTTIKVAFIGDTRDFRRAADQVVSESKRLEGRFDKMRRSYGTFTKLAAGGFVLKQVADGIGSVTKAAADENREIAKLNRLLKNAKIPDSVIRSTEQWVTALQNASGVADTDLRLALGTLVSAGNDLSSSQNILKTAMDVSTSRGLKLQTVVVALTKASKGNVSGLARYGIETKNAAGETKSFEEILGDLNSTFGGATAAAADTAAGKFEIMKLKIDDIKERIGNALLPIMESFVSWASETFVPFLENKLLPAFERFAEWLREQLPKVKEVFEDVIGGGAKLIEDLADAFKTNKSTIIAAIGGIAAALVGLAIAWNAGPGVIITGIVLLVAGFLYLYNESESFRRAMQVTFFLLSNWIRIQMAAITVAFEATKTAIELFGTAWEVVWGGIVEVYQGVKRQLQPVLDFLVELKDIAEDVIGFLDKLPSGFTIPFPGSSTGIPIPGGGGTSEPSGSTAGSGRGGRSDLALLPAGGTYGSGSGSVSVVVQGDILDGTDFERHVATAFASLRRRGSLVA